jgi:hypothetical protein
MNGGAEDPRGIASGTWRDGPAIDAALKCDTSRPVGRRLAAWGALRGWSMGRMAGEIGVSPATISKAIKGLPIQPSTMWKIERYTGLPAAQFIGRRGP